MAEFSQFRIHKRASTRVGKPLRDQRGGRWLSVALVCGAVACLGAAAVLMFGSVPEVRREARRDTALQRDLSRAEVLLGGLQSDERAYVLSSGPQNLAAFATEQVELDSLLRAESAPSSVVAARILIDNALPSYRSFLADHAEVVRLVVAGDREAATVLALGHSSEALGAAQFAVMTARVRATTEAAIEVNREAATSDAILAGLVVLALGLSGAALDVARRMRQLRAAETARLDTEDKYRTLIDHIPAAVYAVDTAGIVQSWNPAATAMFGWSEGEAVGQMLPFVAIEQRAEFARLRAEILAGHNLEEFETLRRRKDGTEIPVAISTAAVIDENGVAIGIIGITTELSERKRIAAELEVRRAGDSRLAGIVNASADAILSASLDTRVTSWNAGAEAMFGYSASEIIGQPMVTLISPEDIVAQRLLMRELVAGRSVTGA